MFNLETYVTPILLSYLDKYVQNFKAGDAQVSLWGGGVTLHNLVLKAGVLQQEVALPFTLISGRIHELLIQVPWTKIMSEPIVVTINTIECILSLDAPPPDENAIPERRRSQVVEAPPGYMQALVRRIVSNISVRINSLIVKYVHDDIVMSLTVKRLAVDSVGADWEPLFADIDPEHPLIRRLVRLDDLTLCLDKCDSDGKIRFYQEPLLYRCQLDLRVLTRLISAKTRRASSFSVQLRSSLMSWGVTNEQLELLLRLCRDNALSNKTPSPVPKQLSQIPPLLSSSSNSAEPVRSASWSQWAWSWLPAWSDREGREETLAPSAPIPVMFVIYLEQVALGFKVLETELGRQRSRNILSLSAKDAVLKGSICSPTMLRVKFGARDVSLSSRGRCVCGYDNINTMKDEQTIYLSKTTNDNNEWKWRDDDFNAQKVEVGVAADEQMQESPTNNQTAEGIHIKIESQGQIAGPSMETDEEKDKFWTEMSPVIYVEMNHDRTPFDQLVNPYDNPPKDFEYSDWIEECVIKVTTQPITIQVCTDLLHRLDVIRKIYEQVSALQIPEPPMRTLTVEECEALSENLPQRRIGFEINGLRIQLIPWDHSPRERQVNIPIVLAVDVPKAVLNVAAPLYSHRVCSAACQMPFKSDPLWQGARLHVSGNMSLQAAVCSATDTQPYPCLDANLNFVTHKLLHKDFFTSRRISDFNYTIKIREVKICGSSARLQAAYLVPVSLFSEQRCEVLNYTTLATDALHDEEAVAIDVSLEELMVWGYRAKLIHTHILTLGSVKATAHHAPRGGDPKQVWLFSGPDTDTSTQYIRTRFQLCKEPTQDSVDYFGVWLEPTAICVDPLFGAWLAYKPKMKVTERRSTVSLTRIMSSAQYLSKRRQTTPSSSGRGGSRSGSGTEQVHSRTRSHHSTHSGESEKKEIKPQNTQKVPEPRWPQQTFLKIYERLEHLLIAVEIGLVNVYVTTSCANATGCVTVRDAIERHAMASQNVLVVSLGHLSVISPSTKQFWERVEVNGPTFLKPENEKPDNTFVVDDAFPWRMRLADVSCYTLEARVGTERSGREKSAKGLKSQLKSTHQLVPRIVLDLVTTSITLSLVARSLKIFVAPKKEKKLQELTTDDATKYFTSGIDFKPSSLKEFVRGPSNRGKANNPQAKETESESPREETVKDGPIVSLGVNIHADTPPINVRVDHDQINVIAEAIHCCIHVLRLLQASPLLAKRKKSSGSQGSLLKVTSELDTQSISLDAESIHPSEELISIFEAFPDKGPEKLKTFLWFQWVVSHATLLVTTPWFRLAFDADDVISSLDMQDRYDQLKIKVASASIKHYERLNDDWLPGVLGGRVLEAREPTNATEESDFLSVTVTSVLISKLPGSLNEELTLKSFKKIEPDEHIWEIYVALAPLEAVLRPSILEPIVSVCRLFAPKNSCTLQNQENRLTEGHRPLIYVSAGGLRLLLADQIDANKNSDDTIMFVLGKTTVNPYPQNPMCRNPINPAPENELISSLVIEGRQYEMLIKGLAVRSVQFQQLANHEVFQSELLKTSGENPALKWSQQIDSPVITPILHSMDINLLLAPPVFAMGALICGPALEVNLVTECSLELSLNRLNMMISTFNRLTETLENRENISVMQFEENVCPYANLSISEVSDASPSDCESTIIEDPKTSTDIIFSPIARTDSGIVTSQSVQHFSTQKKSVDFVDYSSKSSEFLELWIAMWTIDISMYVSDDASPEVIALRPPVTYRPPPKEPQQTSNEPTVKVIVEERDDPASSMGASKSLTDTVRHPDMAKQNIDLVSVLPMARKTEGNIPLWHVKLTLPNLYYYRHKNQRKIQASLFELWVGLGAGESDGQWSSPLLTTGPGVVDPETGIEPALIRVEGVLAPRGHNSSDSECSPVKLDLERPLQLELSTDKMKRLKGILKLVQKKYPRTENPTQTPAKPPLDRFRRFMILNRVENITVKTSSIDLKSDMCSISCKISSLQLGAGKKPDRLTCKMLLCIQRVTVGPSSEILHLLQPMLVGVHFSATWEAWRRLENTLSTREPTVRLGIDLDQVILDIRPEDLDVVHKLTEGLRDLMGDEQSEDLEADSEITPTNSLPTIIQSSSFINKPVVSTGSEVMEHFYSDDFRSGAFKIIIDGPVPMAYQILIQEDRVMWRYPHPRAITKLTISPIPDQETDTECVLELYSSLLSRWERQAAFKIPISEVAEYQLEFKPSEAVFGCLWRVKVSSHHTTNPTNYKFDIAKFLPGRDPMAYDPPIEMHYLSKAVTGQHLFGVLRVDSTFAPRVLPRLKLALKLSCFELNVHNSMPIINRDARLLEGYYVSRPLCRSHRVANVRLTDTVAHLLIASTPKVVFDAELSSDLLNSSTGTLEPFLEEFRAQGVVYLEQMPRLNVRAGKISIAMNVPRVYTVRALIDDWTNAYNQKFKSHMNIHAKQPASPIEALDGRVALWVHNQCSVALRIGQETTKEVVPVGPGVSLAYRWRIPLAPKRLRFAFAGPCTDWHWSNSIDFKEGSCKVVLENLCEEGPSEKDAQEKTPVTLYVRIKSTGARRDMFLSGRVRLVNVLRQPLMYMVRYRNTTVDPWQTITAGVLNPETVGLSVLCGPGLASLKVKLTAEESGWSGDIPVQECRRRNLQWLVKIPHQGDIPFIAVWCRVVRGRSDGRFIATFWPLYMLTSELPLDMNVTITSHYSPDADSKPLYVKMQTAPGRGACTHISTYGKSTDKNFISLQYRDFEYQVTKNELELRYENSNSPVFEEHPPVQTVDEHLDAIKQWLSRSGLDAKSTWPHTLVRNHWAGDWKPALLQPKTAINVCYVPVRVGGGCSLELRLLPQVLFANASTIALTLRSHDGAPVCKIEPGVAIAASNNIIDKPFYMSIEVGRETFVSTKFEVHCKIPGRYEEPSPKHIWLDRPTRCAIHCNQKVALLSLTLEIEESMYVFGITSSFAIRNLLKMELFVATIAVPKEIEVSVLRPKGYKVIQPTLEDRLECVPLTQFTLQERWLGDYVDELNSFLCLSLDDTLGQTGAPILLGKSPFRRPLALRCGTRLIPVVVCQQQHAGRWIITVAEDPCPQFLICNRTAKPLAIAEPEHSKEFQLFVDAPLPVGIRECVGAKWWCVIEAKSSTYYCCPRYYNTYPPKIFTKSLMQQLLVGILREESDPDWSESFSVVNGETLIQLTNGVMIKLNIKCNPHTTLIELLDVDQYDLSASEIRRQLLKVEKPVKDKVENEASISNYLHSKRSEADGKLRQNLHSAASRPKKSLQTPPEQASTSKMNMLEDSSLANLSQAVKDDIEESLEVREPEIIFMDETAYNSTTWKTQLWSKKSNEVDRIRALVDSVTITFANASDNLPILALTLQRLSLWARENSRKQKTTLTVANVHIDNTQYESGDYDFAVVATTDAPVTEELWPPLWNMNENMFDLMEETARLLLIARRDRWTADINTYNELTKLEARVGPLGLYIEDAFVSALIELARVVMPSTDPCSDSEALSEANYLARPLLIQRLYIHPLQLTLTLHTAVRMYIALDQSPLHLSEFELLYVMTTQENLIRALTVHYLSAAILGAGWVVGGLELLGSPAAVAARVAEASGGLRGIASAASAALLRSLSACARSVARNLDILAGDEEHTRRAAAARRRQPPSLMAGIVDGVTNFAVTLLGAVGGLAHHPLLSVVVGETDSRVVGLRRGLVGAIAKPLSATADLVASAGHGILNQTGWDPVPQPLWSKLNLREPKSSWRQNCVRWMFRLPELNVLAGFDIKLGDSQWQLLLTDKYLVIFDVEADLVVESINLKHCSILPWKGEDRVNIRVIKKSSKISQARIISHDDLTAEMNPTAFARVARYTGATEEGEPDGPYREISFTPPPRLACSLHAALAVAIQQNTL
ncbi:vacuolar protein sorting-associated protein 13B isoform X1 [Pieris rapae]|uniref:vacuolar protein sorting-associated protein 13B isoform X1 n=1 Tax=Pieris rapae TaxID=64459 RepID=UPI001E2813F9|nr:vacuolar protein sorting-associated protein 13B isoform X1 [Pieris rapae]